MANGILELLRQLQQMEQGYYVVPGGGPDTEVRFNEASPGAMVSPEAMEADRARLGAEEQQRNQEYLAQLRAEGFEHVYSPEYQARLKSRQDQAPPGQKGWENLRDYIARKEAERKQQEMLLVSDMFGI